jgi:hypothetical protein
MKRFALPLFVLVSCSITQAAEYVLTSKGYGPVKFGATINSLESRIGPAIELSEQLDQSCHYVSFAALPGVDFMVENGRITRADAKPKTANELGIIVGTKLSSIKRKHPSVELKPHQYDQNGHYILFKSQNKRNALVMEEIGGIVTTVRAGILPSVEYVEGCL